MPLYPYNEHSLVPCVFFCISIYFKERITQKYYLTGIQPCGSVVDVISLPFFFYGGIDV